jgi:hypothetical protein
MKQLFNKIHVAFVVNTRHERIQNMFTKVWRNEAIPDGIQHIFEVENFGTMEETLAARSFCGIAKSDVGELAKKNRQPGSVCERCSKKWKTHPRSPWRAWQQGEKIK